MTSVTRHTLSRQVIASAALALTDREGLSGLSMRKLGAELGVEAMSLYHYIASKDDLLDAIVDELCAEIVLPQEDLDLDALNSDTPLDLKLWRSSVDAALRNFYQVLLRHPAAVELVASRPINGYNGFILMYWAYQKCAMLGLSPGQASEMLMLVVSYVMGRASVEAGMMSRMRDENFTIETLTDDNDVIEFFQCNSTIDSDALFELGLKSLLDGLLVHYGVADCAVVN